ncbi:MAG: trypsin-like serine peptidase [Hyphomicrobium sp.]
MLRLKCSKGAGAGKWHLAIRDQNQRVLTVLGPQDFAQTGSGGLWTGRLVAEAITLDLYIPDNEPVEVEITVDEVILMPENVSKAVARYSWKGGSASYESLYEGKKFTANEDTKTRVRTDGDRVGFLVGIGRTDLDTTLSWCCSGIMLTEDIYLTNWHCGGSLEHMSETRIWKNEICSTTIVDLSWDEDQSGREYHCVAPLRAGRQKELDYMLLRVAPINAEKRRPIGRPLRIAAGTVTLGQDVRVIHHAECKRKQLSFACSVRKEKRKGWRATAGDATMTEFVHDCDTESGSSGAPIFDNSGALVGLHHLGHEPVGGAGGSCDKENKAIHILDILKDVKSAQPAVYAEIRSAITGLPE